MTTVLRLTGGLKYSTPFDTWIMDCSYIDLQRAIIVNLARLYATKADADSLSNSEGGD
jgi:hypothetical protein